MRVLKFILSSIAYCFMFLLLTAMFVEVVARLNVKYDLKKEDIFVAEIIDGKLELSNVRDAKNIWFENNMRNENDNDDDYSYIEVNILNLNKDENEETLEFTNMTSDYTQIYTYKVKDGNVIPISFYNRSFDLMGVAMLLSFFTLLVSYFLFPTLKKMLTFNQRMR